MNTRADSPGSTVAGAERTAQAVLGVAVAAVGLIDIALTTRGHVLAGAIADGVLLVGLLNFDLWQRWVGAPAQPAVGAAIRAVALLPLARVAAAGMPVARVSPAVADLMVVLPVGYAAIRFAPLVDVRVRDLFSGRVPASPTGPRLAPTDAVAVGGAVLGLVAYLVGAPSLLAGGASVDRVVVAIAAVTAVAFVEELLFRGLLQTALQRVGGRAGFAAATALFACGYLAAGSAAFVLTFAIAGVVFAHGFARSGDLRGAVVGHWELALGAFIVWPALFGSPDDAPLDGPAATILLGIVLVAVAVAVLRRPLPDAAP